MTVSACIQNNRLPPIGSLRIGERLGSLSYVLDMTEGQPLKSAIVNERYLDEIASAFQILPMQKAPSLPDHSQRLALYTDTIAEEMILLQPNQRWLLRDTVRIIMHHTIVID